MKIGLVTDGSCDLQDNIIRENDIEVVSVHVNTDKAEPVNLIGKEFYEFLRNTKTKLFTSQPSIGQFVEAYKKVSEKYTSIISIHLTGAKSGTVQSAVMAKNLLPELDITIIDSKITSLGLGLLVLEAKRLIEMGMSKIDVINNILSIIPRIKSSIVLDTIEFALKGGRVDGLKLIVGKLLNLKPILTFQDGYPVVKEVVKGKTKSLKRSVDIISTDLEKAIKEGYEVILGIAHADIPEVAKELKEKFLIKFPNLKIIENCAGPALGTHAGPGAVGLFLLPCAHP